MCPGREGIVTVWPRYPRRAGVTAGLQGEARTHMLQPVGVKGMGSTGVSTNRCNYYLAILASLGDLGGCGIPLKAFWSPWGTKCVRGEAHEAPLNSPNCQLKVRRSL